MNHGRSPGSHDAAKDLLAEIKQAVSLALEDECYVGMGKRTKRMLEDIGIIRERGLEIGLSQEFIDDLVKEVSRRRGLEENFYAAVSHAASMIENPDSLLGINLEWAVNYRQLSEKAFDRETQKLWGAILAGEANHPGTFSKRTMLVLSNMSKEEISAFQKLCEYSVEPFTDPAESHDPILILVSDSDSGSYNNGTITTEILGMLHSVGLIDISLVKQIPLLPSTAVCFRMADGVALAVNKEDDCMNLIFDTAIFLPAGVELSRIYDIGTGRCLKELLLEKIRVSGLESIWIDDSQ